MITMITISFFIIIILIRGTLVTESSAQSMESLPSTSATAVTTRRLTMMMLIIDLDDGDDLDGDQLFINYYYLELDDVRTERSRDRVQPKCHCGLPL